MNHKVITAERFVDIIESGYSVEEGGAEPWDTTQSLTIENLRVQGEVVLDTSKRVCNDIQIRNVVFEHVVRLQNGSVQWFSFLSCQFKALVIEKNFLPRSVGNNQIGLLRLEHYSGSGETMVGFPAERIIVANTTVNDALANGLRPGQILEFEDCELLNVTLRRGISNGNRLFEKIRVSRCRASTHFTISGWRVDWIHLSRGCTAQ